MAIFEIWIGNNSYDGNDVGGWNSAGTVWGNSENNTFIFEDSAWAANTSYHFNAPEGNDTIDFFSSNYAPVAFNLSEITAPTGANTFTVLGTGSYNDTFYWNGTSVTGKVTVNAENGYDTLSANIATLGVTLNANDAAWVSIESFYGSNYNDAFNWSADYTATIDGGGVAGYADVEHERRSNDQRQRRQVHQPGEIHRRERKRRVQLERGLYGDD